MTVDVRGRALDDNSLLRMVSEIKRGHPTLGQTMLRARLKSQGFYVTRARVREAIS